MQHGRVVGYAEIGPNQSSFSALEPSQFAEERSRRRGRGGRLSVAKPSKIFKTYTFSYTFLQLLKVTHLNTTLCSHT